MSDAEHQLLLRAKRRRPDDEFYAVWHDCRYYPEIWKLSLELVNITISGVKGPIEYDMGAARIEWVSIKDLRTDETIDQRNLNDALNTRKP